MKHHTWDWEDLYSSITSCLLFLPGLNCSKEVFWELHLLRWNVWFIEEEQCFQIYRFNLCSNFSFVLVLKHNLAKKDDFVNWRTGICIQTKHTCSKLSFFIKESRLSSTAGTEASTSFEILVRLQLGLVWQEIQVTTLIYHYHNFDKYLLQLLNNRVQTLAWFGNLYKSKQQ